MLQFKTLKLFLGITTLLTTTACSQLTFLGQDVACKAPDTSAKFGLNDGPVILYPTIDTVTNSTVVVTGSCVSGTPVSIKEGSEGTPVSVECKAGSFTTTFNLSDGDGSKDLVVSQGTAKDGTDVVDRLCFQKDTTPPAVKITNGTSAQATNTITSTVSGICETGLPVLIWGPGIVTPISTDCENGQFSAILQTSNGDGTKDIVAGQMDRAGNQGKDSTFVNIDTTPPVVRITSAIPSLTNLSSLPVSGVCETGLPVEIGEFRANSAPAVTCNNGRFTANIPMPGADGPVKLQVYQVDLAGNFGLDTKNTIKDTVAPAVTITSPLASAFLPANSTFSGACESGINVVLSGSVLSASRTVACSGGAWSVTTAITSGQGAKTLVATQTDAAGNAGTAQRDYMVDTVAPVLAFTSPATNSYVGTTFTVTGTCEAGLNVQLAGGGILPSATTTCAAGTFSAQVTASPLDGSKVVTASQTDAAGNTGTTSRTFLRDTLPPRLTIASPANNTVVNTTVTLTGQCEAGLTINFTGAGIASASSVVCAAAGTYSTTLTLSAGDGAKAINAREVDAAGNAATADGTYLRDSTAPIVKFTSPNAGTTGQSGLDVAGTCEAGLNVTLSGAGLAANVVTPCVANGTFAASIVFSSGSGNKPVTASQTDLAGNTGSDSRTFMSDTTPPSVTITAPAANSYLPTNFTVTGACETGLNVVVGGTGLAADVAVSCSSGTYSAAVTVSSGDGSKLVTAKQTDGAGNVASASRTYLRDTTAPILTITSPDNGTTGRNGLTIIGTCETGLTVNISGSGVSGASSVACINGNYSASITFSDNDGAKTVVLTETDGAGNSSQVTGTFSRDATAPAIAITAPAEGTVAKDGLTVSGTCESGLNVTLSGTGVANPVVVPCTSSAFVGDIVFSAGSGAKPVTATQTDAVGNVGTSSRNFVRDITAPAVTIASPAANSYVAASFVVQGACEAGINVVLSGAGIASTVTVACANSAYSATVSASAGDGTKAVTATQTDAAGNVGQASRSFLRDSAAPVLAFTDPVPGSAVPIAVTLKGTCETGLTVSLTGGITSASGACTAGAFSIPVTFTAGLGTKNVVAKQTDAAGNIGQASANFLRESDGASETFISDASFGKIDILFIDDNSASMDPKQASLGTKFSGFAAELKSIDWQIGITTTDCSTGPYGICGSLLTMTGYNSKILTPSVPNYTTVFNNSIQRPETAGCLNTGTCPAGASEPLLSATTAMTKFNTDNAGFFRTDSDLAIVILSDADERQTGGATYASRPSQLVSTFNNTWPSGKKLKVYSIIVKPGDSTCLDTMRVGSGGFSFYGDLIDQTVNLTSGLSTSICAPDYSVTLKSIGESVRTLTNSVELAHTPIASSVRVTFTPAQTIGYTVIGNRVVFDAPPSVGTQIQVDYQY